MEVQEQPDLDPETERITDTEVREQMKRSAGLRRFTAAFLASVTLFAFMPKATGENAVTAAAVEKNRDNTWLGVAGLSDPDVPADKDTP